MDAKQVLLGIEMPSTGLATIAPKPPKRKKRYSGGGIQERMTFAPKVDYNAMTVKELRTHADTRGIVLPKRGKKTDFIEAITGIPKMQARAQMHLSGMPAAVKAKRKATKRAPKPSYTDTNVQESLDL